MYSFVEPVKLLTYQDLLSGIYSDCYDNGALTLQDYAPFEVPVAGGRGLPHLSGPADRAGGALAIGKPSRR